MKKQTPRSPRYCSRYLRYRSCYSHYALAFLWIWTGVVSLLWGKDIGYQVLANAAITGQQADLLIVAGAGLDILLGVWLLSQRGLKTCYLIQIAVIVVYSLLLTWIDYRFWWHPFGPLSKNVPIAVLMWINYQTAVDKPPKPH